MCKPVRKFRKRRSYVRLSLYMVVAFLISRNRTKFVYTSGSDKDACSPGRRHFPLNVKLSGVRDFLASTEVDIIARRQHSDYGKHIDFGVVRESLREKYCDILDPRIWSTCELDEGFQKGVYCTSDSFIVRTRCAFVEMWGAIHPDVPGAIFTTEHTFIPQIYARPARTDYHANITKTFKELAVAIYPYLSAKGHFLHETLSRVVWLLNVTPQHVPILAPMDSTTKKYYDIIAANGANTSRIIPFIDLQQSVIFAEELYFATEWPHCRRENPHAGGEPTEYPFEVMEPLRQSFIPLSKQTSHAMSIVVIDRGRQNRHLREHEQLVAALRLNFKDYAVEEFGMQMWDKPFEEHVKLFNRAAVVVGPHGAGFANLVFCRSGTGVVEIGFDSKAIMSMDEMYFKLAVGLHLRYWLVLGSGAYDTSISVDVTEVTKAVALALTGM